MNRIPLAEAIEQAKRDPRGGKMLRHGRIDGEWFYPEVRGLGDLVAAFAKPIARAIGLKDCGGCAQRQAWLNRKVPLT